MIHSTQGTDCLSLIQHPKTKAVCRITTIVLIAILALTALFTILNAHGRLGTPCPKACISIFFSMIPLALITLVCLHIAFSKD